MIPLNRAFFLLLEVCFNNKYCSEQVDFYMLENSNHNFC